MSSLDIPPRKPSQKREVAVVQAQALQRSWLQSISPWSTLLTAIALMPVVYYFSLQSGLPTPIEQYEMIGHPEHPWSKSRFESSSSLRRPAQLNFTGYMEPIFAEYTDLLVDKSYQTWFTDARDADDAITAMLNGLVVSELEERGDKTGRASAAAVNTTMEFRKMRSFADLRAGIRKRAEVNFENFLRARIDVAHRVLNATIAFHAFLGSWDATGKQTPGASCKFEAWVGAELRPPRTHMPPWWAQEWTLNPLIDTRIRLLDATKTPHHCAGPDVGLDENVDQQVDERVAHFSRGVINDTKVRLLNRAARAILDAFIRAHRDLYVMREKPAGLPDMYGSMWPDTPNWKRWSEDGSEEQGAPGQHNQMPKSEEEQSTKDKKSEGILLDNKDRPLWAVADIRFAETAERRLLPYLIGHSASPFKQLWTPQHEGALSRLRENLEALQTRLVMMESQLIWLRERLNREVALNQKYPQSSETARTTRRGLLWVEDLFPMEHAMSSTVSKLIEAITVPSQDLVQTRWRYLQYRNPEAVVSTWRAENCGDTSCFHAADGAWGRFVAPVLQGIRLGQGKPLAERLKGGFKEGYGIADYEKACCGESYANPWLDLLKYDNEQQLWFLNPYHELGSKLIGFDEQKWLKDGKF
jgi:hypothetical protein